MIDADTWWLAPPSGLESRTGNCFATQPAKNRVSGDKLYWQWKYCTSPGVRAYIIPPFYFPPGSVVLEHAIADEAFGKFDDLFAFRLPPDDYNHFLNCIHTAALATGAGCDFAPVAAFNAVPSWIPFEAVSKRGGLQDRELYGWPVPSLEGVLSYSIHTR